jgi:uncharacterized protein with PIN domain
VIERVKEICPHCKEEKFLEVREKKARGFINEIEVEYKVEFTHCVDCNKSWYSTAREQLNKSLRYVREAQKKAESVYNK